MRPKFSAKVIEAHDCSSVNFAGPQMSTCPPAIKVNRAFPSCTVSTLPLNTKLGDPGAAAAAAELSAVAPLSTDTSIPSTRPTAPGGTCCPRDICGQAKIAVNARASGATILRPNGEALCCADCGREHIETSTRFPYTIPQWIPTRNQPLLRALQTPHRHSTSAARISRAGAACKSP
jgi:hypothetical protein